MKYLFFVFMLLFMLLIYGYVALRGWQALQPAGSVRVYFLVISIALFVSMFVSMMFGNQMHPTVAKTLSFVVFSYLLLTIYLFVSFLAVDVVRIFNAIIPFAPSGMVTFRYYAFLISITVIFAAMAYGHYKFRSPQVVELNLTAEKPKQNKEVHILAVSDLHLGVSIDRKILQRYVKLINSRKPDIVLIAGDFSDRGISPLIKKNMKEEIQKISAPLGIFAVMGNHDFYGENRHIAADYMKESGITVLRDTVNLINNEFYVAGRDDVSNTRRKKLAEILKNADVSKPIILLDHQPKHLAEASENNVDLKIAGHTHNGQFFPGNLIVKRIFEVGYGYAKKGNMHLYVSSGLGLWGPQYRIGSQSEIVDIKFRF
jgi:predicted MPP superfamily phosphohydrolase